MIQPALSSCIFRISQRFYIYKTFFNAYFSLQSPSVSSFQFYSMLDVFPNLFPIISCSPVRLTTDRLTSCTWHERNRNHHFKLNAEIHIRLTSNYSLILEASVDPEKVSRTQTSICSVNYCTDWINIHFSRPLFMITIASANS